MNDYSVKPEPNSDVDQEDDFKTLIPDGPNNISDKPTLFTCPECAQSFKTKSSLHYHQRKYRHCGLEPFACDLCGKEFGIATHLTSHMRTHTKQRPFFCPLENCDRVYSRIDLVNVHLIKCHKINFKVKSKCFRDGVFCGQVFIDGEMRTIQKAIPDKAAADGIEIEMPHGLAAKLHANSSKVPSPVDKIPFDFVDGVDPKSVTPPFNGLTQEPFNNGQAVQRVTVANNIGPSVHLNPSSYVSVVHPSNGKENGLNNQGHWLNKNACEQSIANRSVNLRPLARDLSDNGLDVIQKQGTLGNSSFPIDMSNDILTKQILEACQYISPSVQSLAEFRFANMSGGSVTSVNGPSGFQKAPDGVKVPVSGLLPKLNDGAQYPSVRVASTGPHMRSGNVSPIPGTEFPKSLCSESENSLRDQVKKVKKKPQIRLPIEIPKLRVKVCVIPNEYRYKCPDCSYVTDTMPMVFLHMRESEHGGMKQKSYRCHTCPRKFMLKETLCRHMKVCPSNSKIKCAQNSSNISVAFKPVKNEVLVPFRDNVNAPVVRDPCVVRKLPKVEPVEDVSLIAQPKCAIPLKDYNLLSTFGDMSKYTSLKRSHDDNIESVPKLSIKKMKPSSQENIVKVIKSEPGVVLKVEKEDSIDGSAEKTNQSSQPKGVDLPGIETFFSSNFSGSSFFGSGSQGHINGNKLPSFQSFLSGIPNSPAQKAHNPSPKPPKAYDEQYVPIKTDHHKKDKTPPTFSWLNIKSVLKSFPEDLKTHIHASESDPTDDDVSFSRANEYSILDTSRQSSANTNTNPQTCLECKATFKTISLLRYHQHKKSHDGYKPYQCDHCEAGFGSKGHLDTHLRKHTKEKPYYCPLCHRTFSRVDLVNNHLRNQHNMPIHISGKDVLLPKYMWNSEDENSLS